MKARPVVPNYLTTDMAYQAGHILSWAWRTFAGTDVADSVRLRLGHGGFNREMIASFKPVQLCTNGSMVPPGCRLRLMRFAGASWPVLHPA